MYDMEQFLSPELEEMIGISSVMSLLSSIPGMLISIAVYVFTALALYTIANRRGLKNPWMAWAEYVDTGWHRR